MTRSAPPRRRALVLATACALASPQAFAQAASAQPEATELEAITVTAQKRDQQIQDVPIAISALDADTLDALNITGFETLSGYVPGLQTQVQSPNNPGFVIRGITSDSGDSQVEPRVSVYQDGVSLSRSRGAVVEFFDLERIEVLRGPQGTLFGRAAQVGAVHLIQAKAEDAFSARVRVGAGTDSERYLDGHLNAPVVDGVLAARLAVFSQERDGSIENLAGGTLNGRDTAAARLSLRLQAGDDATFDLILNHQQDSGPGTAFRSAAIPDRTGNTSPFGTAELNRGTALGLDREVQGATLLGEIALNDAWSLSTITGWRRFDSLEQFDADGSQVYALEFAEDALGRQASQEVRFNFDGGEGFSGFVGASWFHEEGSQRVPFSTDERSFFALISPVLAGFGVPTIPLLNPDGTPNTSFGINPLTNTPLKPLHGEVYTNYGEVEAFELFADGTWALTDATSLTLGLRGSREDVNNGYEAGLLGTPSSLTVLGLAGAPTGAILFAPTAGRVEGGDRFDALVGRAVLSHAFSDTLNGYASVARGRRPDVVQVDGSGAEVLPAEVVWSYEIGLKGGDRDFRYDVAAFYYDYSDFQAQVENPNPPPFFIATNAGNAHAVGLELSLDGELADGLRAFFNYGYIGARFNALDDDGNPQQLAGNRFRLTPDHTAALGLDWQVDLGSGTFYLRPSATWRSKVFFEDANQPGIEQGAYALVNLNLGWRFGQGRYDIGLYANNLLDEEYLIDAGNTGALFGIPTFVAGSPRQAGVRFSATF
jgi:outer membrane receptor protein involved in Fe transport